MIWMIWKLPNGVELRFSNGSIEIRFGNNGAWVCLASSPEDAANLLAVLAVEVPRMAAK